MQRVFRPTARSLLQSVAFDMSPTLVGLAGGYLLHLRRGWPIWLIALPGILITAWSLLTTIFAHIGWAMVCDDGIIVKKLGVSAFGWQHIMAVTIRERPRALRTMGKRCERLVVFKLTSGDLLSLVTSVYTERDEQILLQEIRRRVQVSEIHDKPVL